MNDNRFNKNEDKNNDYDLNYFYSDENTSEFENSDDIDLSSYSSEQVDVKRKLSFDLLLEKLNIKKIGAKSFSKNKNVDKDKEKKKAFIKKAALSVFLVFVMTACMVVSAFFIYAFGFVDATVHEDLDELKLDFTTTIYVKGDGGEYVEYQRLHSGENRIWVSYEKIPDTLKNAFIAIEDQRFETHSGVDIKRTLGAFVNVFFPIYSSNQGGSTITQQLVKNLTDDRDQSPMRKVREIMRARYLENNYHKDTILECYLNTICLSNGLYGVEVAANYFFDKSVDELTLNECAAIASLAKEPERYRPDKNPKYNAERRKLVLDAMLEQKLITKQEHAEALAEELVVVASKETIKEVKVNNYFVDAVIEDVIAGLMEKYNFDYSYAAKNFYNGGYKIYCTMDPEIQETMEKHYENSANFKYTAKDSDGKAQTIQSAMTIVDYEGHILGLVGGGGEKTVNRGTNRAWSSPRQPGSTIKPLSAYAPSLDQDMITYSSFINDKPIDNYRGAGKPGPNNWYHYYKGNLTAQYALETSVNTIPCWLVKKQGIQYTYDFLSGKLGMSYLETSLDTNLSALGLGGMGRGITTTQSAAAFAIFGNGGNFYEATTYTLVTDQRDNTILKPADPVRVIGEDTATIMNKMLQTVVSGGEGTGKKARSFHPTMPVYAKTGTASEVNDIWFAGGTPYYVASCWYGFDENATIPDSTLARTMWINVMKDLHKNLETKDFEDSTEVDYRYYCRDTGLCATSACTNVGKGYYKKTYAPACNTHKGSLLKPIDSSASNTPPVTSEESSTPVESKPETPVQSTPSEVSSAPSASEPSSSTESSGTSSVPSESTPETPVESKPDTSTPAESSSPEISQE